jgi:uncharacterized protein involved in outer membrane biogenesis
MRRSRVALYSLSTVIVIFAVMVGIALSIDFGRFKGSAETLVSDLLAREFQIDGPLSLTLGRTIELSAEGLRLTSTDWSNDPQLASVRRIDARIDTWSLINGPILIESLAIDGVRVNLEHSAERENNWAFFEQTEQQTEEAPSDRLERFPVMLSDTTISDAILSYANPDRLTPFRFVVNELTETIDDSDRILVRLDGDVNETPLDLEATVVSAENLIEFADVEVMFTGNLGEIALEGAASFADLLHPSRPTAQLSLIGPNVEYLTDILRIDRMASGPLDLSLQISPIGERMQLNLSGDVGEFALMANGQFADLQRLEDFDMQASASGPSANAVAELLGWQNIPDDPFNINGAFRRSGGELSVEEINVTIGETRFDISGQFEDFPSRNRASATVRINGNEFGRFNRLLGLPGRLEGPFRLDADLTPLDGGGTKVDATAHAQNITISLEGNVTDDPDFIGTDLTVDVSGPDLTEILEAFDRTADRVRRAPFQVSGRVERQPGHYALHDVVATIGDDLEFELSADGTITEQPRLLGSRIRVSARGENLSALTDAAGVDGFPDIPFDIEVTVERIATGFVIDDGSASSDGTEARFSGNLGELPTLEGTELELTVSGDELSRLLPPRDVFGALDKSFTLASEVRVMDGTLELSSAAFQIDQTRLTADVELALDPLLSHGSFSVEASSPDLLVLSAQLAEITVQDEAALELRAAGDWADNRWNLDEFDMQFADGTLRSSGTIDGPPNFDDTDLNFDWTIPSLSNFSALAGRELPDEPAHNTYHLTGTADAMSISDFDGVFGDSDITGEFTMRDGDIPTIEMALNSTRLDLTPYLPPELETPAEREAEAAQEDERLIPDTSINIDVLQNFLASATVRVDEMNVRERTLRNITLTGSVENGTLSVDNFDTETTRGGELSGRLLLRPTENGTEFGVQMLGSNIGIGLPAFTEEELEALPTYALDLTFITSGNTVREMAGNMSGYLQLVGGEGRVRLGKMPIFTQDFLFELLNTLNPFSASDPYSNLKCTVVLAAVEDGQLVGDPMLVVESDKMNIFADAIVDLKTEQLRADFNTVPQQGLGLSVSNLITPYVNVSGTLAEPTMGFSPGSAVVEGGLAVATGGLSILAFGLKDRFLSARNPCENAISDSAEEFQILKQRYQPAESGANE